MMEKQINKQVNFSDLMRVISIKKLPKKNHIKYYLIKNNVYKL